MKLRILNSSIRLRLTQSEVDTVTTDGLVKGRLRFVGGESFDYVLESSPVSEKLEAYISDGILVVQVPRSLIVHWAESDEVSIRSDQLLEDGEHLKILVEKDFHCLSPREEEDESDMFPHPDTDKTGC